LDLRDRRQPHHPRHFHLAARELDKTESALHISERARDPREAEIRDRSRLAVAATLADRKRPAFRGLAQGRAEPALADDRAGADDREIGARGQLLGRDPAMVAVA